MIVQVIVYQQIQAVFFHLSYQPEHGVALQICATPQLTP